MKLYLASASPRRKELIAVIQPDFEVLVSDCEEVVTSSNPTDVTEELSRQKAEDVADKLKREEEGSDIPEEYVVVGADTVVAVDGKILGKPKDKEDAVRMIKEIQGRTHEVFTGVTVLRHTNTGSRSKSFHVETQVTVVSMTDSEINEYTDTKEPYDKAGGYGIQGLFSRYVVKINGSYSNVVGLPVEQLYQELKQLEK